MSRSHSLTRSVGTSRTTRCVRTSCSSGVGGRKRVNFCFMPGSLKKMQPGCPAKSIHSIVRKRLPSMQKRALGLANYLRANACVGENFQQDCMPHPAIYERYFLYARLNRGDGAIGLGDHAFIDDTRFFKSVHLGDSEL